MWRPIRLPVSIIQKRNTSIKKINKSWTKKYFFQWIYDGAYSTRHRTGTWLGVGAAWAGTPGYYLDSRLLLLPVLLRASLVGLRYSSGLCVGALYLNSWLFVSAVGIMACWVATMHNLGVHVFVRFASDYERDHNYCTQARWRRVWLGYGITISK